MYLQSIEDAFPEAAYTQPDCLGILRRSKGFEGLKERSKTLLGRVLEGSSGIEQRRFCAPEIEAVLDLEAEALNHAFERDAPDLAGKALRKALGQAGMGAGDLDALIVCTCTGYLCPGVSSFVAEQLGLRGDAYLQDIVGQGCGAAIPTLRAAHGFLAANPDKRVAVVAVEVCSAAFYLDDDPGVLISLCLFGDGASASIWSGDRAGARLKIDHFDTIHLPENRGLLRFENCGGKLRNRLHRSVPEHAAEAVSTLFDRLPVDLSAGRVVLHSGGRDVIEAVEDRLAHEDSHLETRAVLRQYGNLSSPAVLCALKRVLNGSDQSPPGTGTPLWLCSFGAGFACHGALGIML